MDNIAQIIKAELLGFSQLLAYDTHIQNPIG